MTAEQQVAGGGGGGGGGGGLTTMPGIEICFFNCILVQDRDFLTQRGLHSVLRCALNISRIWLCEMENKLWVYLIFYSMVYSALVQEQINTVSRADFLIVCCSDDCLTVSEEISVLVRPVDVPEAVQPLKVDDIIRIGGLHINRSGRTSFSLEK